MTFPLIQIRSCKWDVSLDKPSFSISTCPKGHAFPGELLDHGWQLVLLCVISGLVSERRGPKLGHMKEGSLEGVKSDRTGNNLRRVV